MRHPRADDRVEAAGLGDALRRNRQLEAAGHSHDGLIGRLDARGFERLEGAHEQPLGDEIVEARDDDRETQSGRRLGTLERLHQRPWNTGLRFSTKARVPSRMSSVAAASPKYAASIRAACVERQIGALMDGREDVANGGRRLRRQLLRQRHRFVAQ